MRMKILRDLMQKKIDNEELLERSRRRQFSYEEHISVYLMALMYLGLNDKNLRRKSNLWRKFLTSKKEKAKLKYFKKLLRYKTEQSKVILQAFKKIEEEKEKNVGFGSLYQPFTVAVSYYEFDAN